jgi:glycosyltransferase involved in cell wall biosynthesis
MQIIGINATVISAQYAGAGAYAFNLVKQLAAIDKDHRYIVFANADMVRQWNIHSGNFLFVPVSIKRPLLRMIWEQLILPLHIKKYRITIMHCPHYSVPVFGNCTKVVTFHDVSLITMPHLHLTSKHWFFSKMMAWASHHAKAIIAVSQSTKNDVAKLFDIDLRAIHVVHEACNTSFMPIQDKLAVQRICTKYGIPAGEFILFVGMLEPRKNIVTLLRAYKTMLQKGLKLLLVIAGRKGWMYDDIYKTVKELSLENQVVFTGYVDDIDLPFIYNGATCFVYPSLYEGFGIPVLEAMACGVPVITSNVSSMPEIAGDAALLVDPIDADGLCTAMCKLIEDNVLRHTLGEKGIARARDFSWEKMARETVTVYDCVMGE